MKMKWIVVLTSAIVLLAGPGCGDHAGLVPVSGKVLYQGEPVAGATLYFHREGGQSPGFPVPTAVTEQNGEFLVRSGDLGAGALPGTYIVMLEWRDRSPASSQSQRVSFTPPSKKGRKAKQATPRIRPSASLPADRLKGYYSDIDNPRLKIEIKPSGNDLPSIELVNSN